MRWFRPGIALRLLSGFGILGIAAAGSAARANDQSAFGKSLAQLRLVQQAIGQGKLAEAKAACAVVLQMKKAPAYHRWEAQEQLNAMERLQKGLPARDPAAQRVVLPQQPRPARTLYLAADGDDANPGSQARPLRTLERARDAVRAQKAGGGLPAGGVEICIRGGRYHVSKTFELGRQDSGTEQAPIVYRACEGEHPRFSGGLRLSGFQPVRDAAVLARLPAESRGKVVCVDLKPLGVKGFKPLELGGFSSGRGFRTHPLSELFFNGQAMQLARWPNQGYVRIAGFSGGGQSSKTGPFLYEGSRPQRWLKEPDAWLYGYWFYGWADSYERIASIDPAKRTIALAPPYHVYGYHKGQPFYAVNILAELDLPGEWYLDRSNAVVYFWPPSDSSRGLSQFSRQDAAKMGLSPSATDLEKADVELSLAECPFVVMRQVSHVMLQGLTWELGCGDAIRICGGDHCLVAGCTVRRFGGNGIEIAGGTDHGILSCDLYSMGRGGAVVEGGNRKTLAPGRHFVENCHIYDLSRVDRTYTPAILMSGVGNRIAHNRLHDIPSSAIRLGGNNHLVEYNQVFRVVRESDDQGGVDMFGDPTFRGNVFRFNYWHHIGNWQRPNEGPACGQAGIRLDDAISGVLIYGNLFYRASAGRAGFGGVQIHGGKDNILDNNVFVDCESAISLSPWDKKRWKDYVRNRLQSPEIDRGLYVATYPELAELSENPNRNIVARNLVVQCRTFLRRDSRQLQLLDNLVTAKDPGFRALAGGDFHLKSGSAALRIGLRPIPVDEIGLYADAFRKRVTAVGSSNRPGTGQRN